MTNCPEINNFTDKNIMTDALSTQKSVTAGYNYSANEAANPNVKNLMMDLLNEEHCLQHEVFEEMSKRGWYPTEAASDAKINEVKSTYTGANAQ